MSLALVRARALVGLQAPAITVEVHLANGLPRFTLVGLADVEVKEARERVRSAILNSGLDFPHNQHITVNLAPADLPKDSGRLDLPIALGILAASGQIEAARLAPFEFAGELSLSGELRPVRGALAMSLALRQQQVRSQLVLPPGSAEEAALVPDAQVYRARHLLDVVQQFLPPSNEPPPPAEGWARLQAAPPATATPGPDLAEVKGHSAARRVLEIAAAGGHSVLLVGPPGSGKSMLAQRFAGLLPPMTVDEALESAAVASLAGRFDPNRWAQRPTAQRSVELRVVPRQVEGQHVVEFSVRDSGRGLAPEVLERLYEAFFSTKAEGMGIGLNLCRTIVESHQGRMQAQNIYNGPDVAGCVFSFWIPVASTTQNTRDNNTGVTA